MRFAMVNVFTALVVFAGFLLGLRVGLAVGQRNERRRAARARASKS